MHVMPSYLWAELDIILRLPVHFIRSTMQTMERWTRIPVDNTKCRTVRHIMQSNRRLLVVFDTPSNLGLISLIF